MISCNIAHKKDNNNHFSVTEVKANEEYSVGFRSDKRKMQLNVHLGTNFPNEKPKIVISPRVQHEWIPYSHTGEVQTAPGLLNVNIPPAKFQLTTFFLINLFLNCLSFSSLLYIRIWDVLCMQ